MHSKCGSCGGFIWEVAEEAPRDSAFKVFFVRCFSCKVPIGVMDYYDTHTKLDKMEKSILALGNSTTQMLKVVDENVRRLFQKP